MAALTEVATNVAGRPVPWFPALLLLKCGILPIPGITAVVTTDPDWPDPWPNVVPFEYVPGFKTVDQTEHSYEGAKHWVLALLPVNTGVAL